MLPPLQLGSNLSREHGRWLPEPPAVQMRYLTTVTWCSRFLPFILRQMDAAVRGKLAAPYHPSTGGLAIDPKVLFRILLVDCLLSGSEEL